MKYIISIIFALLYLSTSHAVTEKNQQQEQNNQHVFLVKTDLSKGQVETLLKQHYEKQTQLHSVNHEQTTNEQTQLKVKKEKQQKNKK